MTESPRGPISPSWIRLLSGSSRRSSLAHDSFLRQRQSAFAGLQTLAALQLRAQAGLAPVQPPVRPAVFSSEQLDAFGTGRLSDCLGARFAKYDYQRIPRIPNGDLKMMSRIVSISGQAGDFPQPAEVAAEYDVPPGAWYFSGQPDGEMPFSLLMETALQPCGFLSAYLDTYALVPHGGFFFRNLDGAIRLRRSMPVGGRTIVTRARLLSSTVSGGTVIQKFAFSLTCQGEPLLEGESTFGYFAASTMANQLGLDGGKPVPAWLNPSNAPGSGWIDLAAYGQVDPARPEYRLTSGRLNMLESAYADRTGGRYGRGYVYASRANNPHDWYYPYHFYQDPVMPGSLGVEAMQEAMKIYALAFEIGGRLPSPTFGSAVQPDPVTWRYRGQITQANKLLELEVHISGEQAGPQGVILTGDANLWIDGLRIYEARNIALRISSK